MSLTILSVAYPFAPVSADAAGGAEQILHAVDAALVQAGHRSLVVACEGSTTAGTLIEVPAEKDVIDEPARRRAAARHRAAIQFALSRWRVDLVHLHGVDFYDYAPRGTPTLVTLHLPVDWYPPGTLSRALPDRWFNCVSRSQEGTRPGLGRFLPPIENGIDVGAFGASRKRGFALLLGRICPEKGIDIALEAAHLADQDLIIAGPVFRYPTHLDYFETKVRPLLDLRRRFIGPVGLARKRRLLAAARALLVPSLAAETSSLVAMEALASGTPIVAFPNGALADIVTHGRTGLLVDSVPQMAAAMTDAARLEPALCRAEACARFSLGRMTKAYLAAYEKLACEAPKAIAGSGPC